MAFGDYEGTIMDAMRTNTGFVTHRECYKSCTFMV